MKGVIINCLENLIKEKYGSDKWGDILTRAGLNRDSIFLAIDDVDDNADDILIVDMPII